MNQTPQQLLDEAMEMPPAERGRLAALLIESLEAEANDDVQQSWSDEISQRLKDIDEGRIQMIPWAKARRLIRGQNESAAD
ncbi:MAG TPA: addiction module protein [Planctomicrobium sp.]|nr:addiction module protein [Planctomicrobium sp.]